MTACKLVSEDVKEEVRKTLYFKVPEDLHKDLYRGPKESFESLISFVEEQIEFKRRVANDNPYRGRDIRGTQAGRGMRGGMRGAFRGQRRGTHWGQPNRGQLAITNGEQQEVEKARNDGHATHTQIKTNDQYPTVHFHSVTVNAGGEDDDTIFIQGRINGKEVSLLFDTGAKINLLPSWLFVGEQFEWKSSFRSASGHIIQGAGPRCVELQCQGGTILIEAFVTPLNLAILGSPFTKRCTTESDGDMVTRITF